MSIQRRLWIVASLAVLSTTAGCATTGSWWPSGWFGGGSSAPSVGLAQQPARNVAPTNPSKSGANAQLGAAMAAPSTGAFSAISTSFKKWTGGSDQPTTDPNDPLSLDNQPKQLSPELYVQMARMHEAKGDFVGAIKQYEQALKVAPGNTDVLVGLARAYDRKGDMNRAMEIYQQAIKADARCALAYNDLGLCQARQRDLARARENLGKAVALAPTSKLYRNNLATVHVEARQYNEAYEQLAAVHPPAIAHYNLGILANRRGDKVEAMSRFQQASAADPNLAQAKKMIDKLNGVPQQPPTAVAQEQTRPYQSQWQDQARQAQADWKNQAQIQADRARMQVSQTQADVANQLQSQARDVQTQVNQGVNQGMAKTSQAVREAEAKIRAALQPQVAPIEGEYGSNWVPEQTGEVTPIQASPDSSSLGIPAEVESEYYNISDEEETPILLPPTGE